MSFWDCGCEHHSFYGRLSFQEKVDLGSFLSRTGMKRLVCLSEIWENFDLARPAGRRCNARTTLSLSTQVDLYCIVSTNERLTND